MYAKNKILKEIRVIKGRYLKHGSNLNEIKLPIKLIEIKSKGKFIYFCLENDKFITITLGLTGGLIVELTSKTGENKYKFIKFSNHSPFEIIETKYHNSIFNHINIEFVFDNFKLNFYDQLSFGTVGYLDSSILLENKLKKIGSDILTVSQQEFADIIGNIKNKQRMIGNILIDQKIISGLGNYLRADVMWLSKISPFRKIIDLTKNEIDLIYINSLMLIYGELDGFDGINIKKIKELENVKMILPKDFNRIFFVYNQEFDIYGNPVLKEKLYEGSSVRYIHYVKNYQL